MSHAAGADARVDWEGIRDYFVYETPADLTLKKFTEDILPTLPEGEGASLSYRDVRDKAYKGKWNEARARYLIEKFPGLYTDAEVQYGMLMERFIDKYSELSTRDLSHLTKVVQSLRDTLLNRDSSMLAQKDEEEESYLTRDSVVEMINEMVLLDKRGMAALADQQLGEYMDMKMAQAIAGPEGGGEDDEPVVGADNGSDGAIED